MAGAFLGVLIFSGLLRSDRRHHPYHRLEIGLHHRAFLGAVPVFLFLHRRKLPEPLVLLAIGVAVIGMYLLTGPAGGVFNIGDFLTLICAVIFGAQIYVMGIAAARHDFMGLTFMELFTTAVLAGLAMTFEDVFFRFSWKLVGALAFMTILATAGALTIQTWAQRKVPAVRAGLIFAAEPVFAYIFAFAILGERLGTLQLFGGALIITAIVASELIPFFRGRRARRLSG